MIKKSLAVLKRLFFFDEQEKNVNSKKMNKPTVSNNPKYLEENVSYFYWWNC